MKLQQDWLAAEMRICRLTLEIRTGMATIAPRLERYMASRKRKPSKALVAFVDDLRSTSPEPVAANDPLLRHLAELRQIAELRAHPT